ncbi:MAG: EAL domain-containing protein [Lachnospiraceae bacterium]|nr:EAL domain-containing protein [Lachnospiraceae bacterium]
MKNSLFKVSDYFDNSTVFMAVRQGMVMMIPLLVTGSMALMLISLPIPRYQEFLPKLFNGRIVEFFRFIQSASFGFFAVALALATSYSYAMMQKEKGGGMGDSVMVMLITLLSLIGFSGIQNESFSLTMLGTMNIFTALFVALLSSVLFFQIKEKNFFRVQQRGMEADGLYGEAVSGIVPTFMVVAFFAILRQIFIAVFHVDSVQALLESAVSVLLGTIENGLAVAVIILLMSHCMWIFGIHGSNVLEPVMQENFVQISAGAVYNKTFQDVFVLMGGTGSVLCLVITILLFSKKGSIRNVARLSFPTVVFNISEIIAFGLPVILNPVFMIPYLLVPVVFCMISYAAIYIGIVPHVINQVEWTTPVFLSGYMATGSIAGSILQAVCLVVGVFLYLPFLRLFEECSERRLVKNVGELVRELQRQEEANVIMPLTERKDPLGGVARVLSADLKDAVRARKLFFVYQPQVDTKECCIGAEVLIRWIHPIAGFIYPPLIIQLAKEENMLHDIEAYLFDEAAYAISEIGKVISSEYKISVNITNESLAWEDFEYCMEDKVQKYQISPKRFWLEITEQDALVTSQEMMDKIQRLKDRGHKFLIDDFGMGHTSLMYLQTSHFGVVKLDGSLTKDILKNDRNKEIIAAITELGKSLHFETIAEYVETEEQRDMLLELGCNGFQGYLYSKPIALAELILWMEQHQ